MTNSNSRMKKSCAIYPMQLLLADAVADLVLFPLFPLKPSLRE